MVMGEGNQEIGIRGVAPLSSPAGARQVTGGQPASEKYDFMVSLQRKGTPGNHFCGGSLVHPGLIDTHFHTAFHLVGKMVGEFDPTADDPADEEHASTCLGE